MLVSFPSHVGLLRCGDLTSDASRTGGGLPADVARAKKLGELRGISSSRGQTEFVMKTGWATFPGQTEPNRAVAEACAAGILKTAANG